MHDLNQCFQAQNLDSLKWFVEGLGFVRDSQDLSSRVNETQLESLRNYYGTDSVKAVLLLPFPLTVKVPQDQRDIFTDVSWMLQGTTPDAQQALEAFHETYDLFDLTVDTSGEVQACEYVGGSVAPLDVEHECAMRMLERAFVQNNRDRLLVVEL